MKLGEAILERDGLEERLGVLESRLLHDLEQGRPTTHLQESLQRTANQVRDLGIAITWTENHAKLSGLPLSAYRARIEMLRRLALSVEKVNCEKADAFWESAHNDHKVLHAASWLVDLQVPKIDEPSGPRETKEEEN